MQIVNVYTTNNVFGPFRNQGKDEKTISDYQRLFPKCGLVVSDIPNIAAEINRLFINICDYLNKRRCNDGYIQDPYENVLGTYSVSDLSKDVEDGLEISTCTDVLNIVVKSEYGEIVTHSFDITMYYIEGHPGEASSVEVTKYAVNGVEISNKDIYDNKYVTELYNRIDNIYHVSVSKILDEDRRIKQILKRTLHNLAMNEYYIHHINTIEKYLQKSMHNFKRLVVLDIDNPFTDEDDLYIETKSGDIISVSKLNTYLYEYVYLFISSYISVAVLESDITLIDIPKTKSLMLSSVYKDPLVECLLEKAKDTQSFCFVREDASDMVIPLEDLKYCSECKVISL